MRKTLPKISIVTPSFNQGQYIERTIKSVLDQNYPNLEYWVMDGGSTDQTVKILKKYGKQVKWVSEKDRGQTDAINKGLRQATGDIVAYLNSDDTYEPHTLKTVAEFFLKHPKAALLYGQGRLIDDKDKEIGMYNTLPESFEKLFESCGISQPTVFWRKEVLNTVGFFDESFHFTMDYEYWMRVSKKYELHLLPEVLANSRIHPDAKTSAYTHKLHAEAVRASVLHYGKVHHDWVFTFRDSGYVGKKPSREYYAYMILNSLIDYAKYNHTLVPLSGRMNIYHWAKNCVLLRST